MKLKICAITAGMLLVSTSVHAHQCNGTLEQVLTCMSKLDKVPEGYYCNWSQVGRWERGKVPCPPNAIKEQTEWYKRGVSIGMAIESFFTPTAKPATPSQPDLATRCQFAAARAYPSMIDAVESANRDLAWTRCMEKAQ